MKLVEAKAVDNLLYEELPLKYFYGRNLDTAVKNQEAIRERVAQIPAVDAVPVKHGRWVNSTTCSQCGWQMIDDVLESPNYVAFNYCPNCGAKMDGERRESDEH